MSPSNESVDAAATVVELLSICAHRGDMEKRVDEIDPDRLPDVLKVAVGMLWGATVEQSTTAGVEPVTFIRLLGMNVAMSRGDDD